MIFASKINGIPCQVKVIYYQPAIPAKLWGPPEDCFESEPEELEYEILDRRGRHAPWLERYLDEKAKCRISDEHHTMMQGEYYGPD